MGTSKSGTISVWLDADITAEIDRRADVLSLTRSGYAALVLKLWQAQGFPAVTKADQAMQEIQALEKLKAADDSEPGKPVRKRVG